MSVLIRGMETPMPGDMIVCALIDGKTQCTLATRHRPVKWCEVVEVPTPHGRLIDADAHIQSLKENQCGERCRKKHDCVNCSIGMYIRIIENEPTIIEAEGKS